MNNKSHLIVKTINVDTKGLTQENIKELFKYPLHEACIKASCGLVEFKNICRKLGVKRWPYRRTKPKPTLFLTNNSTHSEFGCFKIRKEISKKNEKKFNGK